MAAAEKIVQLDPETVVSDDNIRFGLKQIQVERLAEDIVSSGGIHTPGEVEELAEPVDGKLYRATVGHYRLAAAKFLNQSSNAGITFPAIVRPVTDATARLKRQLSENVERESLSPMDMAVSIRKLLDASVPRIEIRRIFSRPLGKKQVTYQPASNAWVNMVVSFLDLPKTVQEKIHDGRVGLAAAYELTRVSPDKRAAVLARAEEERARELEKEEKEEAKYLATEQKATEAQAEVTKAQQEIEAAKAAATAAQEAAKAAEDAFRAAAVPPKGFNKLPKEQQKTFAEALESAKGDYKAKEKAADDAKKAIAKLEGTVEKAQTRAQELAEKLAQTRAAAKASKPGSKKGKPVGVKEVRKAAEQENASAAGRVPLNATEMRKAITEMAIPTYPKVAAVCNIIARCFKSELTPEQACRELAIYLKEENLPPAKAVKAAKK